jgi:hypothetical protein
MTVILKNNASGFLATSISATDTSIILSTGTGANFPSLAAGEYFYATISPTSGTSEIVKCTARSGDTLTIIRAQEGTSALSFAGGSRVELRVTAQSVIDAITDRVSQSDQAAEISIVDAGNYYTGTNVEVALQEAALASTTRFLQTGTGADARSVQGREQEVVSVFDFIPEAQHAAIIAGTSTYNVTDDLYAAAQEIQRRDGGILEIPNGLYNVGKQTFAGQTGLGYAYRSSLMIRIDSCTQPVVIRGNGARLRMVNGLRFGSFDPVTGAPFTTVPPFYNADYIADLNQMLSITNCRSVTITDLELDGNINNQIIGGQWGDTGRQISARGILEQENDNTFVQNVYSHHHGLDGFECKRTVTASTADIYPHTYINCRSYYNGRQGISWTGGNNLTMISCDLSHTGKNGVVASAPGAGIDIEPETSLGLNGTFINCRFYNNNGVGMLASTGPSSDCAFYNCQMIGTTNWSGWTTFPRYRFHDCMIVGAWVWPGGSTDPEDASKWYGCKFYMDPAKSPNGVIYSTRMNLDSSYNVVFESSVFYAASGYELPFSNAGEGGTVYSNCTFEQAGAGAFYTRGNFYGHNRIIHSGFWDASGSVVFGRLFVNGVLSGISLPTVGEVPLAINDSGAGRTNRIVGHYSTTVWATDVGGARVGDIVLNPFPAAGGAFASICTVAGTPGTWVPFGPIQGSSTYTVTNGSTDRALDVTADTLPQVAAVLGTLISDLKAAKVLL